MSMLGLMLVRAILNLYPVVKIRCECTVVQSYYILVSDLQIIHLYSPEQHLFTMPVGMDMSRW